MIDPFSNLAADDDPEDQEILKEYLLGKNPTLSIHCVYNGREALSTLNSLPGHQLPSLIILDYKMPLLNAMQMLQEMAKNKWKSVNLSDIAGRILEILANEKANKR